MGFAVIDGRDSRHRQDGRLGTMCRLKARQTSQNRQPRPAGRLPQEVASREISHDRAFQLFKANSMNTKYIVRLVKTERKELLAKQTPGQTIQAKGARLATCRMVRYFDSNWLVPTVALIIARRVLFSFSTSATIPSIVGWSDGSSGRPRA